MAFNLQLGEEKEDLSRQLSHEKNARLLQEQINEEQIKLQDVLTGKEDAASLGAQVCMETRVPRHNIFFGGGGGLLNFLFGGGDRRFIVGSSLICTD